jgi:hypothetical protein
MTNNFNSNLDNNSINKVTSYNLSYDNVGNLGDRELVTGNKSFDKLLHKSNRKKKICISTIILKCFYGKWGLDYKIAGVALSKKLNFGADKTAVKPSNKKLAYENGFNDDFLHYLDAESDLLTCRNDKLDYKISMANFKKKNINESHLPSESTIRNLELLAKIHNFKGTRSEPKNISIDNNLVVGGSIYNNERYLSRVLSKIGTVFPSTKNPTNFLGGMFSVGFDRSDSDNNVPSILHTSSAEYIVDMSRNVPIGANGAEDLRISRVNSIESLKYKVSLPSVTPYSGHSRFD